MAKPKPPRANRKARRAEAQRAAQQAAPVVSYWMVAFLDLLGYRQVLGDLDVFPMPEDEAGSDRMRAALGRAARLRRRLHDSFSQFVVAERGEDAGYLDGIPPQLHAKARSLRAIQLVQSPGPDHYILAASLAPSSTNFPTRAVYTAMGAIASGMLMHLALGSDDPHDTLPLRGGIDIAAGAVLQPENFLYSPALTLAYDLESKQAKYPRTLIGERVQDFLRSVSTMSSVDIDSALASEMAAKIQELFFVDRDGKVALDFYGPVARDLLGNTPLARALAEKAWTYATSAEHIYRAKGDPHVTEKYEWLVAYMRERRRHWA
jgi:hypothetical protein